MLFCSGIDDVLSGSVNVAGIQVQMSFWARTFVKHGWNVYSLSEKQEAVINDIHFIHKQKTWAERNGLSIVQEFVDSNKYLRVTKPDIVLIRASQRELYAMARACEHHKTKLVFLGASDRDFEFGKEFVQGNAINKKLYRRGLQRVEHIVTQNQYQHDCLSKHYNKPSIIIPNIWCFSEASVTKEKEYAAVWVANLRRLKRAEWFVHLAKQLPQHKFAIAGGISDREYYDAMKAEAEKLDNLNFLGPLPLTGVDDLLSKSKLLVCTSEFEGFPNTFLQAWAQSVPVVSTVNPNGCITEFDLGRVIDNESDLLKATEELLSSDELLEQCRQSIRAYFLSHHNADIAFGRLMESTKNEDENS